MVRPDEPGSLASELARRERDLAAIQALASVRHDAGLPALGMELLRITRERTGSVHTGIYLAEESAFVLLAAHGELSTLSDRFPRVPRGTGNPFDQVAK